MPRKKVEGDAVEAGMEEGRLRAEAGEGQPQEAEVQEAQGVSDEEAAKTNHDALSDEQKAFLENAASELVEVKLNPSLGISAPSSVSIGDKLFYADATRNAAEGTTVITDVEYDEIKDVKEPETGLQYVVKK